MIWVFKIPYFFQNLIIYCEKEVCRLNSLPNQKKFVGNTIREISSSERYEIIMEIFENEW